jgi:uncharacterized protein
MGKILFWVVVIIGGLFLSRMLTHYAARKRQADEQAKQAPKSAKLSAEVMVRCKRCDIHLPRSEAVYDQGETWCSTEHAKLGIRQ